MPKTCYCGLKLTNKVCKYALIMPLLAYIFVEKKTYARRGVTAVHFLLQGGTGEFMYKTSRLGNKQLSNMIDREAT